MTDQLHIGLKNMCGDKREVTRVNTDEVGLIWLFSSWSFG